MIVGNFTYENCDSDQGPMPGLIDASRLASGILLAVDQAACGFIDRFLGWKLVWAATELPRFGTANYC